MAYTHEGRDRVEITDKRQPFRALLREGVKGITADEVLTRPLSLREVAARVSQELQELKEDRVTELEKDMQAECASIRLRPRIAAIWQALRARGLRIGVCFPHEMCLTGVQVVN